MWTGHRAVEQGMSRGSVGTTDQRKGRVCREVRIRGRGRARGGERPMGTAAYAGKGFKGRAAVSGDRPVGAASCRPQHSQVSCQTTLTIPVHPRPTAVVWCVSCVVEARDPRMTVVCLFLCTTGVMCGRRVRVFDCCSAGGTTSGCTGPRCPFCRKQAQTMERYCWQLQG